MQSETNEVNDLEYSVMQMYNKSQSDMNATV